MKKHLSPNVKNWVCLSLLSGISLTAALQVKGQNAANISWEKTISGPGRDELSTFVNTPDGGYILGAMSFSGNGKDKSQSSKGSSDFWVIKLNAKGEKQWDKTYGGSALDVIATIIPLADGGYFLAGNSISDKSAEIGAKPGL